MFSDLLCTSTKKLLELTLIGEIEDSDGTFSDQGMFRFRAEASSVQAKATVDGVMRRFEASGLLLFLDGVNDQIIQHSFDASKQYLNHCSQHFTIPKEEKRKLLGLIIQRRIDRLYRQQGY